jgi:hypothetical protein
MKCIACDCFLTETELMMEKSDGVPEDMCFECRGIAFNPHSCVIREYQFQDFTEALISIKIDENEDYY